MENICKCGVAAVLEGEMAPKCAMNQNIKNRALLYLDKWWSTCDG